MSNRFILHLCMVSTLLLFSLGGAGLWSQAGQPTNTTNQDASVNTVTSIDPKVSKYAVGDLDVDFKDEVVVDFGTAGIWLYDQGNWTQLAPENPEGLFGASLGGEIGQDRVNYVLADLGTMGLWAWNQGTWLQLSGANVETMAYGLEYMGGGSNGMHVLFADFGGLGTYMGWIAWIRTSTGSFFQPEWVKLGGSNPDNLITAKFREISWEYLFGDFGTLGMWWVLPYYFEHFWNTLSSSNPDDITHGRWWVAADFGALGLWQFPGTTGGTSLSGADPDFVIPADTNADNLDEIVVDFGSLGLWLWNSIQWTQLTDANAEFMISADVTGDGSDEIAAFLGAAGLWVWNDDVWSQISTMDPEYLLAADTNGDGAQEILADFGALGLWMWNGAWTRISEDNPD